MKWGRAIFYVLCFIISVGLMSGITYGDSKVDRKTDNKGTSIIKYDEYIKSNNGNKYSGSKLTVFPKKDSLKEKIIITTGKTKTAIVNAPEDALYRVLIKYKINNDSILPTQLELKVNGSETYQELQNLVFESSWSRENSTNKDRYGNQIVSDIKHNNVWLTKYIMDPSYRNNEPLFLQLNKGKNTLEFKSIEGNIDIGMIQIGGDASKKVVNDSSSIHKTNKNQSVIIQAEDISSQNDSAVRPGSEFNIDLTPYDAKKKVLNFLDGTSFKTGGQEVRYKINIPKAGNYYLNFNYRQNAKVDFPVFLDILVDGNYPKKDFENYAFRYTGSEFTRQYVNVDKKAEQIYLSKGTHILSLQISIEPLKSTLDKTEAIMKEIQVLALEISNLMGKNVDVNREITLSDYIPDANTKIIKWANELGVMYKHVQQLAGTTKSVGAFSALDLAEKQLRDLGTDTRNIAKRSNELSVGSSSVTAYLGTFLQDINNNGVSIDEIRLLSNKDESIEKTNIFIKGIDSVKRFITSFTDQDYAVTTDPTQNLQVWVNRPRQYLEIMQQMVDESFTKKTGIKVDLSLMPDQNKLILANSTGEQPDVALSVGAGTPFDMAVRGSLLDLSEFSDFNTVASQFESALLVPGEIGKKVYSIPETMNFNVLFYRKDILSSLGLEVPNTIDDVVNMLPALNQKGLNFFYPTAGMSGTKTFAGTTPLIYQNNGTLYTQNIDKTALNSENTIEGIKKLTDLFTIYNMPYDVPSFYQQFRDGSLPIGISDYGAYNLLINAAPEIANQWDIALAPGTVNEKTGEVERWTSGSAESDIIFRATKRKEESWKFLKWWSSAEVQKKFGIDLQTTYGKEYIWNTANLEAFNQLPWATAHKRIILEQSEWIKEAPRVLGTYLVEREISNIYNDVVLNGKNLRKSIDASTKRINRETMRKLEEFGYAKDGNVVKDFPLPYQFE